MMWRQQSRAGDAFFNRLRRLVGDDDVFLARLAGIGDLHMLDH